MHLSRFEEIYLYLRDEYAACRTLLIKELEALRRNSPGKLPVIHLRRGAGAYVCGEESAMIESIEGKRGMPRLRPPYVAEVGLFGRPTLEHNLETLHWVRDILEKGADWFASQGRNGRKGLRSFSVSGRVKNPGVHLAPAGITLKELINEYCETNGIELDQIIVDEGISGSGEKTNQREGYNQILDLIDQGFVETLVVISISRWGRNLGETYKSVRMMKEKNTTFISLKEMIDTKSIYGGFMINILSSLYEMELELIRERTKDTLRMKKENGKVYSKISFGYDRNGNDLIENKKEMKVLRKMMRLNQSGKSFGEISKFLNRNKYTTKKGGIWTRQNVYHTIKKHPLFVLQ